MSLRTCYVSGPMTGYPEYNFPAFEGAMQALPAWLPGFVFVGPHHIDHRESARQRGSLPYHAYLRADLDLLLTCDAIVMLPGWPASRGARAELSMALWLDMPVYFFDDRLMTPLVDMNQHPPRKQSRLFFRRSATRR